MADHAQKLVGALLLQTAAGIFTSCIGPGASLEQVARMLKVMLTTVGRIEAAQG